MISIQVSNLVKKYGNIEAVRGISFEIKKGEIFGILGPNGAGKTSTINCICQLASITDGTIKVNGHDVVKDYVEAKKQIGLSPQELQFDMYFSLLDILIYQGGYFGLRKEAAKKRAITLLKEFNLYHKRDVTTREISGGMKRKLSIIKALMHQPSILILDEPTAGLDVDSRYELWGFIKKLKKSGITIILTTHYIEEAEKLCERLCILSKGKIIKLDKTKKITDDLSHNILNFELAEDSKMPVKLKKYSFKYKNKKLRVMTSKKEQQHNLNEVMSILIKAKIKVKNFSIEQDSLENIFRRLVK